MAEIELTLSALDEGGPAREALKKAYEAWNIWRGTGLFPAWKNVDMLDLPNKLLPWTVVVDRLNSTSGLDYTYRFWGSSLSKALGREMSQKSYRELPDEAFRDWTRDVYEMVCTRREPILFKGRFVSVSGTTYDDLSLRMPIGDDGENVDKVISLVAVRTAWNLMPGDPGPMM